MNYSKERAYAYRISAVAALGGLLFGFDTAVINGAIVFLKRQFSWSEVQTEIAASSLLLGCVIGASVAGALSDWLGRRYLLMASAALFAVSSLATALPNNLSQFCAARGIAGVAIGIASMLAPLYIAEISPASIRGRLVSLNQLAIISGILVSYLLGWYLSRFGETSWRWMFASAFAPSLMFLIALFFVPESPRWLAKEGRDEESLDVLRKSGEGTWAETRLEEIKKAVSEESGSFSELFEPARRRPLMIGVVLAILQQVTGINTILYYGSIIFTEQVGETNASAALFANVVIGLVGLVCTVAALFVIDRIGRKTLLMTTSAGMGISLAALGMLFHSATPPAKPILVLILCYVGCFSLGMGPGVWVIISELFPTRIRGRAMSLATICIWASCLAITLTFLSLVKIFSITGVFWLYGCLSLFTVVFVWQFMVETRGKTLEEIEKIWHG